LLVKEVKDEGKKDMQESGRMKCGNK